MTPPVDSMEGPKALRSRPSDSTEFSAKSDGTSHCPTPVSTAGQRALVELGESPTKVAAACGVSRSTANRWRSGQSVPRGAARDALAAAFGIHPDSWDVQLEDGATAAPSAPERPADPGPAPKAVELPELPPAPPVDAPTLDRVRHALACIRRDLADPTLSWAARSNLTRDEIRNVELVMRLEREQELSNPRAVIDHPRVVVLFRRLRAALEGHPEAVPIVEAAIAEADERFLVPWRKAAS